MDKFAGLIGNILGKKIDETKQVFHINPAPDPAPVKVNDDASYVSLKNKNYNRSKFTYETLKYAEWWPDKIMEYIEVLRIAYVEFIQSFSNRASLFDTPLRNSIYFMSQYKYSEIKEISNFIKKHNTNICDKYLNTVIKEDNCYMDGLEDRFRVSDEKKHEALLKAVEKLISMEPIEHNGISMDNEYIILLRIYIVIYDLKNNYAKLDSILRNSLILCLNNENTGPGLSFIFLIILDGEIDNGILIQLRKCENIKKHFTKIFNCTYLFRDLILYGLYKTLQFKNIFDIDEKYHTTIFKDEKYVELYTRGVIDRLEIIYDRYIKKLNSHKKQDKLLLSNSDFNDLIKKKRYDPNSMQLTPKYSLKDKTKSSNKFPIFTVDDRDQYDSNKWESKKHMKKSTSNDFIPLSKKRSRKSLAVAKEPKNRNDAYSRGRSVSEIGYEKITNDQ